MYEENRLEFSTYNNDDISPDSLITNSYTPLLINGYNHDSSAVLDQYGPIAPAEFPTVADTLSSGKHVDDGTAHHGENTKKKVRLDLGMFTNAPVRFYSPNPEPPPIIQPEVKQFRFLPEDILHEIFSHALRVSDADFSVDAVRSPFGRRTPSTVNILLVCQQWYRVGHPYVYECLVFRNDFQVQSFYNMVMWYKQGKTEFQKEKMRRIRYGVRRLRLEDAFGSLLMKSLKLLDITRIVSLFVNIDRGPVMNRRSKPSSYSGAIAAIESINPNRVVLDWNVSASFSPVGILETLTARLPQWDNLKNLEVKIHYASLPKLSALFDSLFKARNDTLQILFRLQNRNSLQELIPILWQCAESPSKQATSLFIDTTSFEVSKTEEQVKDSLPTLPKTLKIFSSCCTPGTFRPFCRSQKKEDQVLQQTRRFPISVILKIVDFMMEFPARIVGQTQYNKYLDQFRNLREASSSKVFQDYCTSKCWKTIYITGWSKLEYLSERNVYPLEATGSDVLIRRRLDQLAVNPGLQEPVYWRHLSTRVDLVFEAMLRKVLILSIPLRHLMLPREPNTMLHTLALHIARPCTSAGSFLSTIPGISADVGKLFACFPNVRHLFLTGCSLAEGHLLARPKLYLWQSTIQDIHLDGTDESLFIIMKCIFVSASVLHLHHAKNFLVMTRPINLTTIFYHIPNLRTLYISMKTYKICFFETLEPNRTIRKIVFYGHWSNDGFSSLIDIIQRIDISLFESLEEMQFDFFDRPWTWTKREIDVYIKWLNLAGEATKNYGVKFMNKDGVVWAPRLYCAPQRLSQLPYVPRPRKRKKGEFDEL